MASWTELALCRADAKVPRVSGPNRRRCNRCPVMEVCLITALLEERNLPGPYRHGLRGGLDGRERAALDVSDESLRADLVKETATVLDAHAFGRA